MASQLLCRASSRVAARHTLTVSMLPAHAAAASIARCAGAACVSASPSVMPRGVRLLHASAAVSADAKAPASKKKKEVVAQGPMVVPTSMAEYEFSHLNVLKEYKDPADKVVSRADASYPPWIWDQSKEPSWSDLLLADFSALPPTYQKKVFSIPRKQEIKRKNDITRKG